jgi:hypothetical protein
VGGLILAMVGFSPQTVLDNPEAAMGMLLGGTGALAGGMIFGFFRGMSQYKKQNAVAAGFSGNPLEHVSFGVVPGVGGSLIYSTLF